MKTGIFIISLLFSSSLIAQPDWTLMSSGTTKDVNAIWGSSPYNMYAVGEDGLILHYDGIVWENVSSGITSDLVDIIGFSENEIYILGYDTLFRFDGNNLTGIVIPDLPSWIIRHVIWGTSGSDLYVGVDKSSGAPGGLFHYNGVEWESSLHANISIIHGVSSTEIYVGAYLLSSGVGVILHHKVCDQDDHVWDGISTTSFNTLSGLWVAGNNDTYASTYAEGSNRGGIYHFTGELQNGLCSYEVWNRDTTFDGNLIGIWGLSSNNIYTFGTKNRGIQGLRGSYIVKFNGNKWSEMTTQTDSVHDRGIHALWGTDTSNVFAVGENGLILKLHGEIYDTLVVNKTSNEPDLNPGDGFCDVGGPMINGKPSCTLNAAIMESNASQSDDNIIIFDLPGELPQTIFPSSGLPVISDKVVIKAPRISGESTHPIVIINGSNAGIADGLSINNNADSCEIHNLIINSFSGNGIYINGSSANIIKGCIIGTDNESNSNLRNAKDGIYLLNSSANRIGGRFEDETNIISGNRNGVVIHGSGLADANTLINNIIGPKVNGLEPLSNIKAGVVIRNSNWNSIEGEDLESANIISANFGSGIEILSSSYNIIQGNIIGLNKNGGRLGNAVNGITLYSSSYNFIGETDARNVISDNNFNGIAIFNGSNNLIKSNFIGTGFNGTNLRGNFVGIYVNASHKNTIGFKSYNLFDLETGNIISGNRIGIQISGGYETFDNITINNIIGSNFNNDDLGNKIGVYIKGSAYSSIGTLSTFNFDSTYSNLYSGIGNKIAYNITGIQLESPDHKGISIAANYVYSNRAGIRNISRNYVKVVHNRFSKNDTAVVGLNCKYLLNSNYFEMQTGSNSSIHLYNSYADIKNNFITLDAGDAIKLEDGSTADINYNNIFDNAGYGLNNNSPSFITNAQYNWWGDPNGPGGQGPGNGDPVSSGVDFSNWLPSFLAVIINAPEDTIFTPINNFDSTGVFVGNWLNPQDTLNISLNDNLNWLQFPTNYSVFLDSVINIVAKVKFQVPSVTPGTKNLVQVTAVSQSNPSHSQTDTFYIEAYQPVVNFIFITPDTIYLAPGDSIQFFASGYDQHNKLTNFTPQWNSNGGTINSEGWFAAGTQTGTFEVTATDPSSQVQDTATVIISIIVGVKEELAQIPTEYNLYQNYPNPFNPVTTIRYAIPFVSEVTISVFNILGERIEKLISEMKAPGIYEINWNASKLASGVYIYLLHTEAVESNKIYRNVKKMILLK